MESTHSRVHALRRVSLFVVQKLMGSLPSLIVKEKSEKLEDLVHSLCNVRNTKKLSIEV